MNQVEEIIENHDVDALKQWLNEGGDPNGIVYFDDIRKSLVQLVLHEIDSPAQDQVIMDMLTLLINNGADANISYDNYFFPLFIAVRENRPRIIELLLRAEVNTDLMDDEGNTPLIFLTNAVLNEGLDCKEALEILLENSKIDTINRWGGILEKSPLSMAFSKADIPLIELLINKGASVDAVDGNGMRPFDYLPSDIASDQMNSIKEIIQ